MRNELPYLELAESVLSKSGVPLKYKEIWKNAEEFGLLDGINYPSKTPWDSLKAQLYVDIKRNPNSIFCVQNKKPTKFFLKKLV